MLNRLRIKSLWNISDIKMKLRKTFLESRYGKHAYARRIAEEIANDATKQNTKQKKYLYLLCYLRSVSVYIIRYSSLSCLFIFSWQLHLL